MARAKNYSQKMVPGFGTERTVEEWAKDLKMGQEQFQHYTETRGLTVEELYDLTGRKYTPKRPRKQRMSEAMYQTVDRMRILLDVSGYGDESDWATIEVKRLGNKGHHVVSYLGKPLGVYAYRTGQLELSGGQGLPLWKLEYEDAKIVQNSAGLWEPHPDTHALLRKRATRTDIDEQEAQGAYNEAATKFESQRPAGRKLYEGFKRKYTCATWARVLDVPRNTLWRHLKKGETIEEFAASRGINNVNI